ncbi:MAG: glycosyltransferase family 2 protein, partial [Dolichospermum sp.]
MRRELFEKVGGFDPNYPLAAHEDQDLKIRIEKIVKIDFVPKAKVSHPVRLVNLKKMIANIPK